MARRRSRRSTVKGKPNLIWVCTAGDLALVVGDTVYDALLVPGDWSGTVTEQSATLLRMVLTCYTYSSGTASEPPRHHAQNFAITMGNASEGDGSSSNNISDPGEWPDFFAESDRVLRLGRLEWDGTVTANVLPVQFSQLPEPILNLKTPRALRGDDSIRLNVGGRIAVVDETPVVTWFCRSLVRIGLR